MSSWFLPHVLLMAAAIPPIVLMVYIYRKDKVEREPPDLLLRLFLGGALSVFPAIALEMLGYAVAGRLFTGNYVVYAAFCCFAVVGVAEELVKYCFLKRISWFHPAFNYRFDAIVYAVFVSMGFALVENISYVLGSGAMATALLRGVTAIPGHAAFAVFMGFYYGNAKCYAMAARRCTDSSDALECQRLARVNQRRALWVPALFHGFYDFCLEIQVFWMSGVFLAFVIALHLTAIHQVRTAGHSDIPV